MFTFLCKPNHIMDESERLESFELLLLHILSRSQDVVRFGNCDRNFCIQTEYTDIRYVKDRYIPTIPECFPWLTFELVENFYDRACEHKQLHAIDQSKFTTFETKSAFLLHDWIEEKVYSGDRERVDESGIFFCEPKTFVNDFIFPEYCKFTYDGTKYICYFNEGKKRQRLQSLEEIKDEMRIFVCDGTMYRKVDEAKDLPFAFRTKRGFSPFEYLIKGTMRRYIELPEIFSEQEMQNSMVFWYKVASAQAKTPKTVLIPFPCTMDYLLDQKKPPCFTSFCNYVLQIAEASFTYPLFLRTDTTSGKHDFVRTCYLKNPDDLKTHIANLIECVGLADLPSLYLVLREYIPGDAIFTAFRDLPIRKEFRFFVKDGKIAHVQPYWPEEAFSDSHDLPKNWKELLESIAHLSQEEYDYLAQLSRAIANELPGNWSIDWLYGVGGWYCIDMAKAEHSYIYDYTGTIVQ